VDAKLNASPIIESFLDRMVHPAPMPASLLPAARYDVAHFGEMVSDPSRVAMLLALLDDSRRPATELAEIARVAPPTASAHLRRLVEGGLLRVEQLGRHRYFRLSSAQVAEAIEALALLSPERPASKARSDPARLALTQARTCYRHLAGRLGVAWFGALERLRYLALDEGELSLTEAGRGFFAERGLEPARWPAGKPCLDWTERRHHLGGPLATLLTDHLFALRWLARRPDSRAVRITATGERELQRHFRLRV
jgi:DNA-binding transcriptional ArsR family regulator